MKLKVNYAWDLKLIQFCKDTARSCTDLEDELIY